MPSECKYLIICSDGVWEFLSNEQVMNFATKFYESNENDAKFIIKIIMTKI